MKVIISHDIDHISVMEHKKDLIVPKFIVRSSLEFISRKIGFREYINRHKDLFKNKWQNLESLMKFNKENNIPSTFFFGVSNGKGLSYSLKNAAFWIKRVQQEGFDIGVHGIAFENFAEIKKEYDLFKKLSGLDQFGIRMHYLRFKQNTDELLSKAGYLFDSSVYEMKNPFKIERLWEFPLHILDGCIICKKARWQDQTLTQAKEMTKRTLEDCFNNGIDYFTVLFHDRYFSDSFKTWKGWYIWLINYLKENKLQFINYHHATKELENFDK